MNNEAILLNSPKKHVIIIYNDFDDFNAVQDRLGVDFSYECIVYDNNIQN